MSNRRETGIALITALLILLLVSSIIIGLSWMVMTDQRLGGNNSDRQAAFYAAEAGMEKMTADIGEQYTATNALSSANITSVMAEPPVIPGVSYTTASGSSGYSITYSRDGNGNPLSQNHTILTGAYAGLQGLLTPFNLSVTARLNSGAEAKLTRTVQTVGIPVFQFGIFCQNDCSYFPGPDFNFGGRVHTNTNLWLAAGGTLTFADKVTAVKQVILTNLANGYAISNGGYGGQVMIDTTPENSSTATQLTQGSVTGNSVVGNISTQTNSAWPNLSTGTFNGEILNGVTGASQLTLTVATPGVGGTPIELIRRPVAGENTSNPTMLAERYFSLASVRIMLSDYGSSGTCSDADMMGLPGVTATAPIDLATLAWNAADGHPASSTGTYASFLSSSSNIYPLPTSGATSGNYSGTNGYWITADRPIINGCIKIEYQNMAGTAWTDATQDILKQGFTGRNLNPQSKSTMSNSSNYPPAQTGLPGSQLAPSSCTDPSPNAVIRLARLRDNPSGAEGAGGCGTPSQIGTDYWPNSLFDTREGTPRDNPAPSVSVGTGNGTNTTPVTAAGVMDYVELDVTNLSKWFKGTIGAYGALANNTTGYTVYFSDRRGSRVDTTLNRNTGSYGFNDNVNPSDPTNGCPNGTMDIGEDLVGDNVLRTYGKVQVPFYQSTSSPIGSTYGWTSNPALSSGTSVFLNGAPAVGANSNCSMGATIWPGSLYGDNQDARENPPLFFRRALKIVNGGTISIGTCNTVPCGLTIASENPAYLFGDYNNTTNSVATSIVADAVTFLSDNWNDVNSFAFPYNQGQRVASNTTYRVADISGKGLEFPQVSGTSQDYGTDGGVHNFLRYIENWGSNTLTYEGSMVSFFYSQQLVGPFKCCTNVYSPPTRNYSFDTNFLTPSLLPPRTPMLRDVDTIGFSQVTSPAQ